jgi:hypothetical protein
VHASRRGATLYVAARSRGYAYAEQHLAEVLAENDDMEGLAALR